MLAVRRSSVRERARMPPSYLIIEVARLVDASSIALSIAEPPRWTPGTAVAVPLHEAERHRCIAMALWYTGAEVRARSDQGNAGYVPLGSHHRRIVIPITVRQVKVASLRRQSLSMPAPNTPQQTLPWSAPASVLLVLHGFCPGVAWLDTGVWHGGSQYPSRSHAFGHPGLQNAPCA